MSNLTASWINTEYYDSDWWEFQGEKISDWLCGKGRSPGGGREELHSQSPTRIWVSLILDGPIVSSTATIEDDPSALSVSSLWAWPCWTPHYLGSLVQVVTLRKCKQWAKKPPVEFTSQQKHWPRTQAEAASGGDQTHKFGSWVTLTDEMRMKT